MITLNNRLANKLIVFLSSPLTALAFSVVTGVFFYYLSINYKSPSYYFTPSELIAKKTNNDFKIIFKDSEVDNVFYTSLTLWNDGEVFIDQSDFVKSRPIKFFSPDKIKILSATLEKTSRPDLKFKINSQNDSVYIELANDEALEEGDGGKFNIVYTKLKPTVDTKFKVDSRIKGTKYGFVYKDLTKYKTKTYKVSIYFLWTSIILLLCIRIITLYIFRRPIVFRTAEFVFILTALSITIYLTIQNIFFTTNLNWI